MASSTASRPHARFTVAEFHRLCELLPERRLELIDGEVLEMIAKGSRHTAVVHRLARTLTPLLVACGYELRIGAPPGSGGASGTGARPGGGDSPR
jgi:Uma2 family endonuclease